MRAETAVFEPGDSGRRWGGRSQHGGPWTWIELHVVALGTVRTVFLPQGSYDAFRSICDAWRKLRANSIKPDDFAADGRSISLTSLDWPLRIHLVSSPDDCEKFLAELSALPENSPANAAACRLAKAAKESWAKENVSECELTAVSSLAHAVRILAASGLGKMTLRKMFRLAKLDREKPMVREALEEIESLPDDPS